MIRNKWAQEWAVIVLAFGTAFCHWWEGIWNRRNRSGILAAQGAFRTPSVQHNLKRLRLAQSNDARQSRRTIQQ